MNARYLTADVFTDRRFGGNQLAVFPDAREIAPDLMPQIAREFNYSETTFVLPPDDPSHTAKVRIFTPGGELQFAGHPTVGTAHVLATIGAIALTGDETRIVSRRGRWSGSGHDSRSERSARLRAALRGEAAGGRPAAAVERDAGRMLSLSTDDVLTATCRPRPCRAARRSCSSRCATAPPSAERASSSTRSRAALGEYVTDKVIVFAMDGERPGSDVRARMFAPGIGVAEDPATGSACVALGGYLAARDPRFDGTLRWIVEQGFEMGRPSILEVEADKKDGKITAARVGGKTVVVCEGTMTL